MFGFHLNIFLLISSIFFLVTLSQLCFRSFILLSFFSVFSFLRSFFQVIVNGGVVPLAQALESEREDHLRAASAWSLGQIGRHSSEHAKAVSDGDVLPLLLDAYIDEQSSDDLQKKAKRALKNVVQVCDCLHFFSFFFLR